MRHFVKMRRTLDHLVPVGTRLDVDLDDARVGSDAEIGQARVGGRLVTFEENRRFQRFGGRLNGGNEFEIVVKGIGRRHENVEHALACLHRNRRARDVGRRLLALRWAIDGRLGGCRCNSDSARSGSALFMQFVVRGQRLEGLGRIGGVGVGVIALGHPGLRIERQAVTDRRIAGYQKAAFAAQEPRAGLPEIGFLRVAHERKNVADDLVQPLPENRCQTGTFERIVKPRIVRVDVDRQAVFAPKVVKGVLVGRKNVLRRKPQTLGQTAQETPGQRLVRTIVFLFVGAQRRILPHRLPVAPPVAVERPARQLFAGIPLALTEVHQSLWRILFPQAVKEIGGADALGRPQCIDAPFGTVRVVDRHEGRLAAHGQAYVSADQIGVDTMAERFNQRPLLIAVGFGDARCFPDAFNAHAVLELAFAFFGETGDR